MEGDSAQKAESSFLLKVGSVAAGAFDANVSNVPVAVIFNFILSCSFPICWNREMDHHHVTCPFSHCFRCGHAVHRWKRGSAKSHSS